MNEGFAVKFIAQGAPVGEMRVHQGDEPRVMIPFEQMHQLMHHHILKTADRLLSQLKLQPDAPRGDVTGAPFRFHLLDAPLGALNAEHTFPVSDQLGDALMHR